jgi:selenocysteine lyase/cysteine desulfurase
MAGKDYAHLYAGLDVEVPLLDGSTTRYINFDNAASTPPLKAVQDALDAFMPYYSSVHRGTGFKSQLSTHAFEEARHTILRFVGADPAEHTLAFVKNTTEAINKLARRFPFTQQRDMVLTSRMEHHSNDLPWRQAAEVCFVELLPDGRLDLEDFQEKLNQFGERIALVSISAGSNVTGFINPIYELAEMAHAAGALFMADCAQYAPHRKVDMLALDDARHLDFIAISAHKLYAPYGSGALIGRRDVFEQGTPDMVGGGVIDVVTRDAAYWAGLPDREEAGSPNHVGAIALAAAVTVLEQVGMENVAAHEAELTRHALGRLTAIPQVTVYGDVDSARAEQRLGVLPFNVEGMSHFKVAAILGYEFGIGVRNGCFCAHPLIFHLLDIHGESVDLVVAKMLSDDKSEMPGLTRASFGLYNTVDEVDRFADAIEGIIAGVYRGEYVQDRASGEYMPMGWTPEFERYFTFPRPETA